MKYLSIYILIAFYIISCTQRVNSTCVQESICNLDSIKKIALLFLCNENVTDYSDKDSIYFRKFAHYGLFNIQNLGKTNIYKGFTDDGSNAGTGYYYFLLSEKGKKGIVFVDDSIFFIKRKQDDTAFYIGSIANIRNGMVEIYDFINNKFQKVFSSLDDSDYEFSTYTQRRVLNSLNYGMEYTIWSENGGLKFENIDINNDGFLDIKFSGKVKAYMNDSPDNIYEKYIEMIFLFNPKSSNIGWTRYAPNEKDALPFDIDTFLLQNVGYDFKYDRIKE